MHEPTNIVEVQGGVSRNEF